MGSTNCRCSFQVPYNGGDCSAMLRQILVDEDLVLVFCAAVAPGNGFLVIIHVQEPLCGIGVRFRISLSVRV